MIIIKLSLEPWKLFISKLHNVRALLNFTFFAATFDPEPQQDDFTWLTKMTLSTGDVLVVSCDKYSVKTKVAACTRKF